MKLPSPYARMDAAALEAEVERHDRLYWEENQPEIADEVYDRLVERLRELAPDSPVLSRIGGGRFTRNFGSAVEHRSSMLSLDKCYSEEDLLKWASKFEGEIVESPKIDGNAVSIVYDDDGRLARAATRGDGIRGEDITQHILDVRGIPGRVAKGPVEVRGEVYLPLSVFRERFEGEFANPRNLAAGALRQKLLGAISRYGLCFAAYDLMDSELPTEIAKLERLAELGLTPVPHALRTRDEMQTGYEGWRTRRNELDYEIDGVVYKANRVEEQKRMGFTAHHPRFSIAYKLQGDAQDTRLNQVEWSVARTGAITPVALVEPVVLSGATIGRALLHNWGMVRKMGLRIGDQIEVMRRGGVIPNVEGVVTSSANEPVQPPEQCPSCGKPPRVDGDFVYCSEPGECPAVASDLLRYFAKVVELDGFGDELIRQLFERGLVREPADFYRLDEERLLPLDRMGRKLATKLLRSVESRRQIPLATFLRALGVSELGKSVAGLLAEHFGDLERVRAVTAEELAGIHGIGGVIAEKVVTGLRDRAELIDRLLAEAEVVGPGAASLAAGGGPLAGKKVVFTGKLKKHKRKQAQELVRSLGGETPDSVVKELDYLVVGEEKPGEKSSKALAAERYNGAGAAITILSEAAFWEMIGG